MLAAGSSQANAQPQRLYIDYLVPLTDLERRLVNDIAVLLDSQTLIKKPALTVSVDDAFREWKWANLIDGCMKDFLGPKTLRTEYQGDHNVAYSGLLEFLEADFLGDQNVARVRKIEAQNPNFISTLSAQPDSIVRTWPAEEDLGHWRTLAVMFSAYKRIKILDSNNLDSWNGYDIFQLTKRFVLFQGAQDNQRLVMQSFIGSSEFRSKWKVRIMPDETSEEYCEASLVSTILPDSTSGCIEPNNDTKLSFHKRGTAEAEIWPESEPIYEANGHMTRAYLKYLMREEAKQVKLEDPRYFVHFIQWDELQPIDEESLHHAGINTNVPFVRQDHAERWFLWKPSLPSLSWNHHLHTEDEVFEYNMLNLHWPDHYMSGLTVFRAREIATTEFIGDLQNFWDIWNDCAITQAPQTATLLLLETIPGLRYRSRCKYQDREGAMMYFRSLVENHARSRDTELLRDALELEATYAPVFENSLRLIKAEELSEISWHEPLGRGANGIVFAATYSHPPGVLATTNRAPSQTAVVLKQVLDRHGSSVQTRRRLVKELDVTFASLGGEASGCINFLGLAILNRAEQDCFDNEMFLVFERATQGPILSFLAGHFKDMDFLSSWDTLVTILASIATGISSLHDHEVIHRDLHMNNILVTDHFIPHDLEYPHEFKYLLSDVGEGKILRDGVEFNFPSNNLASYGATEFRAPEVRSGAGWSTKAEVFSFGVIATKVMQMRRNVCTDGPPSWVVDSARTNVDHKHGDEEELVPIALKKAIELCLQFSAKDRPGMKSIVHALDDLSLEFVTISEEVESNSSEESPPASQRSEYVVDSETVPYTSSTESSISPLDIKWTYWDWKGALRLARKPEVPATPSSNSKINLHEPLPMLTLE